MPWRFNPFTGNLDETDSPAFNGEVTLGSAASPSIFFTGDPNTGIYSPGADQLALSTNGTGRLFVDAAGNVGIGTTTPQSALSFASGSHIGVATTDTADNGVLTIGGAGAALNSRGGYIELYGNENASLGNVEIAAGKGGASAATAGSIILRTGAGTADERARIDSSGRLLVGTSSSRANFFGSSTFQPSIQVETLSSSTGRISAIANTSDSNPGGLILGKTRATSLVGNTVVQANDWLGFIQFMGADGTNLIQGAAILAAVDGTPGANDMPGRLVFSVTADGSASPSEAMRINNAGELLVGYTSDNGAYKLQVNSQIFATSAIIATSDGRYKENVAALDGCVDLVKALRPVSFDWKVQEPVTRVDEDGETVVVREAHNFPDGKQVGFIAQEVEEVLADKPWLGSVIKQNVRPAITDADGNELAPEEEFLGIAEGNLVAVLTSALKDAIGRIESLEAEVAALKA